ncbi:MAG: N-formylglutamate amidohydrolase [Candidatus Cloacimonetes bacterium]|nr:N-formylglutamate amidohydrolase [Candidatus Cloacimonadota bacterium]
MIKTSYHFSDFTKPVLALAIHNGHEIPEEMVPYSGIDAQLRLREEDPHTGTFARMLPNHVIVETSRFAIDLNRPPHRAIYKKPEDAWGLPVRCKDLPDILIESLENSYNEWYATLRYEIDRMLSFHPFLVVFDLHSFNHRRGGPDAEPDAQIDNPDIILGRNNMPEEYYPYIENLRQKLDGLDYFGRELDVRCDVKFPGGQLSRWLHSTYPGQLLCLAVEFKKIFMDEWSSKLNPVSIHYLRSVFTEASEEWLKELPLLP